MENKIPTKIDGYCENFRYYLMQLASIVPAEDLDDYVKAIYKMLETQLIIENTKE